MIEWISAAIVLGVVAAALHRPTFFRLGWRYLRANPRQGAVAVVGLMVGMAVLVGTGVTTDSASAELERQLAARRGSTDATARFAPTAIEEVTSWLASPDLEDIEAAGLAYRARDAAVDPLDGAGLSSVAVVGVDEGYQAAVRWEEIASAPGEGVALTRSLADALGVTAGDGIRMYLPPSPQADARFRSVSQTIPFNGTLVAAAVGPEGPVHSDEDVYSFALTVPEYADRLAASVHPERPFSSDNWTLVVTDADGTTHIDWGTQTPRLEASAPPFGYLTPGEWTIEVHAEWAANAAFGVEAQLSYLQREPGSPPGPPPPPLTEWHTGLGTFHGKIVAAANGPQGPTHSPEDRHAVHFHVPQQTFRVVVDLEGAATTTAWTLTATAPDGTVFTAQQTAAPTVSVARILVDDEELGLPAGNWTIEVHPDAAAGETFLVRHAVTSMVTNPDYVATVPKPIPVEQKVIAVVEDAADPDGTGMAVLAPLALAQAMDGQDGRVDTVVMRIRDGADVGSVLADFSKQANMQVAAKDLRSGPAQEAAELRKSMSEIWAFMGGFTVVASLLLVFVLMALLVDERRPVLATMRAVGTQRADVAKMQMFEAFGYGLGAALAGIMAGFGLALLLRRQSVGVWESGRIVIDVTTVLSAVLLGLALLVVSAAVAAYRSAGMDVASALRGEETAKQRGPWARIAAATAMAIVSAIMLPGAFSGSPVYVTLAPSLAILSAGMLMSTKLGRHVVYPVVGAALLLWLVITYGVLADIGSAAEALLLPARAIAFCTAAALLLIYSRPIHSGLSALAARLPGGFALESALGQVRGRPGRSTLTVLMISMVILSVSFMQAVIAAEQAQSWRDLGDFDVVATTDAPIGDPVAWLQDNPPMNGADPFAHVAAWADAAWSPRMPPLEWSGGQVATRDGFGVTPRLVAEAHIPSLSGPSAAEAFQKVLQDPTAIVIADDVRTNRWERPSVGDTLRFESPEQQLELTVVAVLDARWMSAVFVHPETLDVLVNPQQDPRFTTGRAILAIAESDIPSEQVGRELAAGFRDSGMDWEATGSENAAEDRAFAGMLLVFVMLALAVGALSLGLIAARNVISRRREIGMARSVGAPRNLVVAMVLSETLYLVAIAVAIGFVGSALTLLGIGEASLRFDVAAAAGLAIYAFVLGATAAALPAWSAARLQPAEAVRYVE